MRVLRYYICLVLLVFILTGVVSVGAQDDDPVNDRISFTELGFSNQSLGSPYSEAVYVFGLPAHWTFEAESQLQLNVNTLGNQGVSGTLEIVLNGTLLDTVVVDWNDVQPLIVTIPPAAMQSIRRDQLHELRVILRDDAGCTARNVNTIINADSLLIVEREEQPIPLDLGLFPYPFYQRTFIQDQVLMVVPDEATANEMQAALMVTANLAALTDGQITFDLLPESEATEELLASRHLILVGVTDNIALTDNIDFPDMPDEDITEDSGILQMAVSPWNDALTALLITGANEDSLLQAAQAVARGNLLTSDNPASVIVSGIDDTGIARNPVLLESGTLAESNYTTVEIDQAGITQTDFKFFIPFETPLGTASTFNLVFNHSPLLNYDRSGINVQLNGEPIRSIRMTDETSDLTSVTIALPSFALRFGVNELSFETILAPRSNCYDPRSNEVWAQIWPESSLSLDETPGLTGGVSLIQASLSNYLDQFTIDSDLVPLAFVLPSGNSNAWTQAGHLAFRLGAERIKDTAGIVVTYDAIPEEVQQNHNLIIIGQDDTLLDASPDLNDVLPIPFGDADTITDLLEVDFQLSEDREIGYLELFFSPWNENRLGLVVGAFNSAGLQAAVMPLVGDELSTLDGNLALVDADRILAFDTRISAPQFVIPEDTDVAIVGINGEADTAAVAEVDLEWIPTVVFASTVLIVLILLGVAAFSFRGWRRNQSSSE